MAAGSSAPAAGGGARPRRPCPSSRRPKVAAEASPLVKEADPALEALLAEEEEIERRTRREHHEAPKFHGDEE